LKVQLEKRTADPMETAQQSRSPAAAAAAAALVAPHRRVPAILSNSRPRLFWTTLSSMIPVFLCHNSNSNLAIHYADCHAISYQRSARALFEGTSNSIQLSHAII
jgi:hypothetical protein